MTPSFLIPLSTKDHKRAQQLRVVLSDAARLLDEVGAWPTTCGPIEIRILNDGAPESGDDEETTQVYQMATLNESVDQGHVFKRQIARKDSTVASILVSVDLFRGGLAAALLSAGASEREIAVHFLAHEIHHLTEIERLSVGNFRNKDRASRFASAFQGMLPEDWRNAITLLVKEFSGSHKTPEIEAAEDIADEAAADLLGLYWFNQALPNWKKFAEKLVEGRKTGFYAIAPELVEATSAEEPLDPSEIYLWCWRTAFEKALSAPNLPVSIRSALVSGLAPQKQNGDRKGPSPVKAPRSGR